RDALRAAGRDIVAFRSRNLFFGGVQAVERDPATGALAGAGDPRRGGVAVAACGAGAPAHDLFLVQRGGAIPGAKLALRVTDDGRASCNRGPLVEITS